MDSASDEVSIYEEWHNECMLPNNEIIATAIPEAIPGIWSAPVRPLGSLT